ncbi:required for respiratory growth protein 9, mitochondrial [Aspergillus oleicola]
MSFTCPNRARLSLPNVLRNIFASELAPQLRISSTRPLNRPPLPRQSIPGGRRTITTIPINSVPVASADKPQPSAPIEYEPSPASDTSEPEKQVLIDQLSAEETKSPASSKNTRRAKPESKKHSKKSSSDRDAIAKKPTSKNQTDEPPKPKKREQWEIQKDALKKKFPAGWAPAKKLSPDAIEGIRHLHSADPDKFNTAVLAQEFKISPESIRRILKSKWRPSATEAEKRRERWENRHERIWGHMAELGLRPKRETSIKAPAVLKEPKRKAIGDSA